MSLLSFLKKEKRKKNVETLEEESRIWHSYPRPLLRRDSYYSLNGTWKLNGKHAVTVPFPPQSALSGYKGRVPEHLIYEKDFVFEGDEKKRTLLHFGAVDQICEIYLNGRLCMRHGGGYLPFTLDVTGLLHIGGEVNHLMVRVLDNLSHAYPYGKQSRWSHGMWYTPVSGIWQSVWIEQVPMVYINSIRITPDLSGFQYIIYLDGDELLSEDYIKLSDLKLSLRLHDGSTVEKTCIVKHNTLTGYFSLKNVLGADGTRYCVQLWSPENPYLYDLSVSYGEDTVTSYVAFRTIQVGEVAGVNRLLLNGRPVFMHGLLDQGYYPDGLFLPSDPSKYEEEIRRIKSLGFNMLRKHIKIEPEIFYYTCDRLGILVIQDMVQSGHYSLIGDTLLPNFLGGKKRSDCFKIGTRKRRDIFEAHTQGTIWHLYNHPSIVVWTLFNEGWGQYDTDRLYLWLKSLDKTRLVDSASGWFKQYESSDFMSEHIYYKNQPLEQTDKPLLLSECGGFSYAVDGHLWKNKASYGYGRCENRKQLMEAIHNMYEGMVIPAIDGGLCGSVYTQITDVENEINGIYTYDREVCKVDAEDFVALSEKLYSAFEKCLS